MAVRIIIAILLFISLKLIGDRQLVADSLDVYIINYSYHTGIVIPVDSNFKNNFVASNDFTNFKKN